MKTVADAIIDKFTKDYNNERYVAEIILEQHDKEEKRKYKESTIDEVSKLFSNSKIIEVHTTCHNCGGILTAIRGEKGIECKCDTCGMIVFVSNDY